MLARRRVASARLAPAPFLRTCRAVIRVNHGVVTNPRIRAVSLPLSFVLASAGVDVALASAPGRGVSVADVVVLLGLALIATVPFVVPGALLAPWRPDRGAGVALGCLIGVHAVVAVRFGPLLNAPLSSPPVLGSAAALSIVAVALGWLVGPRLARADVRLRGVCASLALLGLAIGALRVLPAADPPTARGPNVLLVTMDTLRRDRVPVYGPTGARMPNLVAVAERGAVFEDAVATAPQTGPSHLAILTGRLPMSDGHYANGTHAGDHPESLPRMLDAGGWATAGFVSAFPVAERFGFDQGFDVFDSDFSPWPGLHELNAMRAWDMVVFRNLPRERRGDATNTRVLRWLEDAPEPFFLWVHYYDPHGPYTPPPPFDEGLGEPRPGGAPLALPDYWPADHKAITDTAWLEAAYDAEVTWTDHLFGQLVDALRERGDLEDTLIVVTADHGESMTEHGILFDHGDDLYDPAMRVPLVVAGPGVTPGTRVTAQTSLVDVAPTVLDLLHIDASAHAIDGRSRARELRGEQGPAGDAFGSTTGARVPDPPIHHMLRRSNGKCILRPGLEPLYFDLARDPAETANAYTTAPEAQAACADLKARTERASVAETRSTDAETLRALEQLGYMGGDE